ncbi:MAG: hypothetical protein GXO90_11875 [FCB group bacterium]|nr:hypothetical protein [FCB group bacterium]
MKNYIIFIVFAVIVSTSCEENKSNKYTNSDEITDIDGNIYKTIKIGNQVWMAENLRVTHFRNGNLIPNVYNNTWMDITAGAYTKYNNDDNIIATYGLLYNWFAIADSRNLAPVGWHIPSDEEWQELIDFLGGSGISGGKLKESDTTHWDNPNIGATNESGFTALPGGRCDGDFYFLNSHGYFWAATDFDSVSAWVRILEHSSAKVYRFSYVKQTGLSVRCIKD